MAKSDLPTLIGGRVILRAPREDDVQGRLVLGRDPEIHRMYGGNRDDVQPLTEEAARSWVQSLVDHDYAWIIDFDSCLIGHVRLDRVDLRDWRASLAVGIEDKIRLGLGLGPEAIKLVLEYAFDVLNLHRVSVRVLAYNTRAIRAYEKCGFLIEGRERESAFVDGAWHDDVIMGIIENEFRRGSG